MRGRLTVALAAALLVAPAAGAQLLPGPVDAEHDPASDLLDPVAPADEAPQPVSVPRLGTGLEVSTADAAEDDEAVRGDVNAPTVPFQGHHTRHPPIRIDGNQGPQGFVLANPSGAPPVYRPGSGVVAGEGTAQNPYVIEGWEITPTHVKAMRSPDDGVGTQCEPSPIITPAPWRTFRLHAIEIVNTDAHVVIKSNFVHSLPQVDEFVDSRHLIGVMLKDADNVRIEANQLGDADGRRLFRGICAKQSDNLEVVGNTIEHGGNDAIQVEGSPGVTIADNTIRDGNAEGIDLAFSDNAYIAHNSIQDYGGVFVVGSEGTTVEHNTVDQGNTIGIAVASDNVDVLDNVITNHPSDGIHVSSSTNVEAHGNNIEGNRHHGVDAFDSAVNAENNWWGCSDGPTDPDCDSVDGNVDYDPWLTAPNSNAGA